MSRLTQKEKDAILAVVNERLAGIPEDLQDALGCSLEEATDIFDRLESAVSKLSARKEHRNG